jgi:SAM-dependent methyltransferase
VVVTRERRLTFGEVAEQYDRSRPSYPAELVDDVLEVAQVGPSERVLEVGAGTGKATILFAERGLSVLALEPSADMAAVARRNCAQYPGVRIEQSDFEHWRPDGVSFPLVFSAQAWHWVAPDVRYSRARQALHERGAVAAFWNRPDWGESRLRDALGAAYRAAAPELAPDGPMHPTQSSPPALWGSWKREIDAARDFEQPEIRSYRWTREYSTEAYVSLLETHSDHRLLEPDRRASLLAAVAAVIDEHGGTLRLDYVTLLCLARAV